MRDKKNNEEKLKSMIIRVRNLNCTVPMLGMGILYLMAHYNFTGPLATILSTVTYLAVAIFFVGFLSSILTPGEHVKFCNFLTKDNKREIIWNKIKGAPNAYCKRVKSEIRKIISTPVRSKELKHPSSKNIELTEGSLKTRSGSGVDSNPGGNFYK